MWIFASEREQFEGINFVHVSSLLETEPHNHIK